jgi:hypothetical protein
MIRLPAARVSFHSSTRPLGRSAVDAILATTAAAAVGLAVNAVRPSGLPFIATAPYQTLVPCPEPGGPVEPIAPDDPALASERTFIIDARPTVEYRRGHLPGAVSLPYDWLDPVPEDDLKRIAESIAASGARRVAVYGDGGRPDSGEHLGREISGRGIKNVGYISGGAPTVLGEVDP